MNIAAIMNDHLFMQIDPLLIHAYKIIWLHLIS